MYRRYTYRQNSIYVIINFDLDSAPYTMQRQDTYNNDCKAHGPIGKAYFKNCLKNRKTHLGLRCKRLTHTPA